MLEAVELLSFCHEETAEAVDRRAVGVDRVVVSRTPTQARQPGSSLGVQPGVFERYSVGAADRCRVAFPARRVFFVLDLLAAIEAVGRTGCLALAWRTLLGALPGR